MAKDATPGTRAWPRRDPVVDQRMGIRWDWGEKVSVGGVLGQNLVLQANKGAKQGVLRGMADRDSHAKLVIIHLNLQSPPGLEWFVQRWYEGLRNL